MLRELLSIFRSNDAIAEMGDNFTIMLDQATELTLESGRHFFEGPPTPEERTSVSKKDIQLNKLERRIRKQAITHLALGEGQRDAPFCLLLMSLVKDVERIGDYCKNLSEIYDDGGGTLPDDENSAELQEIRTVVEEGLSAASRIFAGSETDMAMDLIRRGREINKRCDALVKRTAQSDYNAQMTATMILGARYYKRIQSHLLNVLSGVVMPLHKVDYYDERALPDSEDED